MRLFSTIRTRRKERFSDGLNQLKFSQARKELKEGGEKRMKKILLSLVTIAVLAGVGFALSKAQFTDTETANANVFDTGTIDIAVDGNNPWNGGPYELTDMKPSQTDYINFVVHNVGTNPVNLFKTLSSFREEPTVAGNNSESKCVALQGTWDGESCSGSTSPTDMASKIRYDLRVELYQNNPQPGDKPYWWETIYTDSDNIRLNSLPEEMYLGMIPVGHFMKVIQSYHMDTDTGNAYQGEKLIFDITLNAEQLTNTVRLENKYLSNTDVSHHVWNSGGVSDGKDATLIYKVKDDAFNYTLAVEGMSDGPYTLVSWEDTGLLWTWGNFTGTRVLANVNVSSGIANISGSPDFNSDIINAKVWLVPGNLGAPGTTGVTLPWDPTNTLFETGLIDYYDSIK